MISQKRDSQNLSQRSLNNYMPAENPTAFITLEQEQGETLNQIYFTSLLPGAIVIFKD